tara:strand:+ start:219 stop:647 length:429 start_codon:yes stop_codon:yes gene_type:complete
MIIYRLICKECEISFDSWFSSSKEYEKLKKQKFLNCHFCNSSNVEKTLMSPSILGSKGSTKINHQDLKYKAIKKIILDYQNFIKKNLDYVGQNFAYEARSLHYKNKKVSKGIYGTASKKDLRELKEEGIETELIAWVKDTTN